MGEESPTLGKTIPDGLCPSPFGGVCILPGRRKCSTGEEVADLTPPVARAGPLTSPSALKGDPDAWRAYLV